MRPVPRASRYPAKPFQGCLMARGSFAGPKAPACPRRFPAQRSRVGLNIGAHTGSLALTCTRALFSGGLRSRRGYLPKRLVEPRTTFWMQGHFHALLLWPAIRLPTQFVTVLVSISTCPKPFHDATISIARKRLRTPFRCPALSTTAQSSDICGVLALSRERLWPVRVSVPRTRKRNLVPYDPAKRNAHENAIPIVRPE